uniref:Uncharacterized protein n=1 Tax=Meloidogyne enterolobii TaxID=390850 RepID=A0A6V7VUN6_MELEN|nr:unnamed protein product [Meloidogyne enterolobii]
MLLITLILGNCCCLLVGKGVEGLLRLSSFSPFFKRLFRIKEPTFAGVLENKYLNRNREKMFGIEKLFYSFCLEPKPSLS